MDFLPKEISRYSEIHTQKEPEILEQLSRETWKKVLMPRMLSGHLQGRVLSLFSKLIQPKRILEIGTYTGYSAICLAEGLAEEGKVITIDKNDEVEHIVRKYLHLSGNEKKVDYLIGDAIQILPALNETFDLVFIDADKENYNNYFEMVFQKVRSGGIIIADNVLWSGKVLSEEELITDRDTAALHAFNTLVQGDPRVENILLPIRDGLMLMRKI